MFVVVVNLVAATEALIALAVPVLHRLAQTEICLGRLDAKE